MVQYMHNIIFLYVELVSEQMQDDNMSPLVIIDNFKGQFTDGIYILFKGKLQFCCFIASQHHRFTAAFRSQYTSFQ